MAGPDCGVTRSTLGGIGHGGSYPSVRAGKVLRASLKGASAIVTAPDDHRSPGPHGRMIIPTVRGVTGAGSCPTIRGWIVSATGVHTNTIAYSAPDDHFIAGPYGCV